MLEGNETIPATLEASLTQIKPHLSKLEAFLKNRISADLSDFKDLSITSRQKSWISIYQKLQTGRYANALELPDLVGLTVVVLHRRDVLNARNAVANSGLTVHENPARPIAPTDFRYHQPKLVVGPPEDYLTRNSELRGILAEVQFTTAIQHALDKATHDFDYKGKVHSWSNFRLVAQLRGMLELADRMLDDIESVSLPSDEIVAEPPAISRIQRIIESLGEALPAEKLPPDRRRLAETVLDWLELVDETEESLEQIYEEGSDLLNAQSLDATSALLGALLRFRPELGGLDQRRFVIGPELESLCPEAARIGPEWRVGLDCSPSGRDISEQPTDSDAG